MTPAEVRTMDDASIAELLMSLRPGSDEAVAWLASVIADPAKVAGVCELARRYTVNRDGRQTLPRAKSASSVWIDGTKFKEFFFQRRIPLREVGPMVGKCAGFGSVAAHKGRLSFWTADAIANELGLHVDAFLAQVGTAEEVARLEAV
jgi:hypothetical protein